jgi:hypothetical protein
MKQFLVFLFFFAVQPSIFGQFYNTQFDTLRFMYKINDSIYIEEVPNVSVDFVWTNVCVRFDIHSDTSTVTKPLASFGVDLDSNWAITMDGDYFIFDTQIQEGLMYRIWFDRKKNKVIQVLSINVAVQKAMLLR